MYFFWPPTRGITFFDVWSLPHFGFWIVVGSTFWVFRAKLGKLWPFLTCLSLAIAWELFEKYAEYRWPEQWLSPESWVNSWLSDPFTCVVGFLGIWYLLDRPYRR